MEVIIHPAAGSQVKIFSPAHPAKIRFPGEDFPALPITSILRPILSNLRRQLRLLSKTIVVTNKRLDTGQTPFREDLNFV